MKKMSTNRKKWGEKDGYFQKSNCENGKEISTHALTWSATCRYEVNEVVYAEMWNRRAGREVRHEANNNR